MVHIYGQPKGKIIYKEEQKGNPDLVYLLRKSSINNLEKAQHF